MKTSVLMFGMFVIALRAQDATRGGTLYKQQCVACHGERLEGRSGPPLTGGDFPSRWPASDLVDKIKNTMPQQDPGKLTAAQAADLAAYCTNWGFRLPQLGLNEPTREEIAGEFGPWLNQLQFRGQVRREDRTFDCYGITYVPNPYGEGRV